MVAELQTERAVWVALSAWVSVALSSVSFPPWDARRASVEVRLRLAPEPVAELPAAAEALDRPAPLQPFEALPPGVPQVLTLPQTTEWLPVTVTAEQASGKHRRAAQTAEPRPSVQEGAAA
jgi:hypothetical protein